LHHHRQRFELFTKLRQMESERANALFTAEFAGKSSDDVERMVLAHKVRAEELREQFEGLDGTKYPERKRILGRQMLAERLATSRGETALGLMTFQKQKAAALEVQNQYAEREAQLKKVCESLRRQIAEHDAQLSNAHLDWAQRADLRAGKAGLVEKLNHYQEELRRHIQESWGRKSIAAAKAAGK
jgi:hypothetical protein